MSLPDPIVFAARAAKGKKPTFTEDPLVERLYAITLALTAELAVARERSDTLERLLDKHGVLKRNEIEGFVPNDIEATDRATAHQEYLSRVFRTLLQDESSAAP